AMARVCRVPPPEDLQLGSAVMTEDSQADQAKDATAARSDQSAAAKDEPTDDLVTTHHTIMIGGEELAYTVTAGRVVLRTERHTDDKFDGAQPKAEVFMMAYTVDGGGVRNRPVTFAFNGGPGSSSVWLHLGLLGPRRVDMGDAGALLPPPYGLVDNEQTLLKH